MSELPAGFVASVRGAVPNVMEIDLRSNALTELPADLADLMERCWAHEASARPSFVEIKTELASSSTRAMIASPSSESLT